MPQVGQPEVEPLMQSIEVLEGSYYGREDHWQRYANEHQVRVLVSSDSLFGEIMHVVYPEDR